MEKAKNELYSKEGKPPTVSQIDSYKDDYLHDEQIDDEKRNEVLATAYIIIGEVETALKLLNDKQK